MEMFQERSNQTMKTKNIRLSTIADVRDFVNAVAAFDGEVDLSSGRYVVDGKSIMGIFSLDLLSPIVMTVQSGDADALFAKIEKFVIVE
jgi:phosphotransferase system HPr-like phosphotransfer protein